MDDVPGTSGVDESRTCLLDLSIGIVENLRRDRLHRDKGPEGFCDAFQVCLPYHGLFVWHVGGDDGHLRTARHINDRGMITGQSEDRDTGERRAFLAIPIW